MLPSPADSSIILLGESSRDFPDDEDSGRSARFGSRSQAAAAGGGRKRMTKMFWHSSDIEFVQELVPEQVRWLYKEDSKGKWIPFVGYDSLRMECQHRALEQTARPEPQPSDRSQQQQPTTTDVDSRVHVRGGLYEADLIAYKCRPMYWKGDELDITRGTWFEDSSAPQPVAAEHAANLETAHLARFRGERIAAAVSHPEPAGLAAHAPLTGSTATNGAVPDGTASGVNAAAASASSASATASSGSASPPAAKKADHHLQFEHFHVEWYGPCDVYKYSESRSSRVMRTVTHTLGMQKHGTGTRLIRGYSEQASMEHRMPDVSHLVFVVHGIGQKRNQNRIVTCADELRANVKRITERMFPDLADSSRRVEFLPVEWRSKLALDGDSVESITPEKLKTFRTLLNSTAMDILYYTSPLYRSEIVAALETELNRLYSLFCENHPYFDASNGKVSIIAHSLGCVIMYDILTGWDPIMLYDQYVSNAVKEASSAGSEPPDEFLSSQERSRRLHDFYLKSIRERQQTSLNFQVTNFFCLGSPLGVFLSLRGVRPQTSGLMDHILPKSVCTRLFNIYYASDPVAYRLEPLVLKHYSTIAPLRVHRLDAPNKTPYTSMAPRAYAALPGKGKAPRSQRAAQGSDAAVAEVEQERWQNVAEQEVTETTVFGSSTPPPDSSPEDQQQQLLPPPPPQSEFPPDQREMAAIGRRRQETALSLPQAEAAVAGASLDGSPGGSGRAARGFAGVVRHLLGRLRRSGGGGGGGSRQDAGMATLVDERLAAEMVSCEDSGDDECPSSTDDTWESLSHDEQVEHTDLEHRLDYVLPSVRTLQSGYWGAIFSHTSYWQSQEVALFFLTHIFPEQCESAV